MDPISELENAIGAQLLRARLLRQSPPTLAHRYTVEDFLGRGASGLVVAAIDVRLNRPVALKLRPVEGDSSALAEARALAKLDHPNVVRIHDVDIVWIRLDGRDFHVWIVSMPRLEGRTMRAWLQEKKRSPAEILSILIDAGRGLAAAHEKRIVHRDVKPDNVVVRTDGVAQVLDFGFAVETASSQSAFGGVRPAAGTDPYMAPEARLGRTSHASDQFSLGVTLVEALSGAPVPAGMRAPRHVSSIVWRIARRATSPDVSERFPDIPAMVGEMSRALRAPPPSRWLPLLMLSLLGAAALAVASGNVPASVRRSYRQAPAPRTTIITQAAPPQAEASATSDAPPTNPASAAPRVDGSRPSADTTPTATVERDPAAASPRGGAITRCAFVDGTYHFQTVADGPSHVPRGAYTMGLETRRGQLRAVSLRRTAPRRDQLEVQSFAPSPDCTLLLETRAENRDYTFRLSISRSGVRGTFQTTRGSSYGGRVEPAPP